MKTIVLLTISNVFMTFALVRPPEVPHLAAVDCDPGQLADRFAEYCFQIPANRIGSYQFSTAQLKNIQEVVTLLVFAVFSVFYLGEGFRWNYAIAFGFLVGAVFFMFKS